MARLVEKAKGGDITVDELADALIVQAEIDQAGIPSPDNLVIRFPGFADTIGAKLEQRVVELIKDKKVDGARQLERFSVRMLGPNSKYTQSIANIVRLNDQFERMVLRGTPETVLAFREALQSDIERALFSPQVEEFLSRVVKERAAKEPPMKALRSLALFGDAARAAGADAMVVSNLVELAQQAQSGALDWNGFILNDPKTEQFLFKIAADKPEVRKRLLEIYEARTKALVRANAYKDAEASFSWILEQRPDPDQANNRLRRDLAAIVSGAPGKRFATRRIEELAELGDLGSFEEIYYYLRGYYGEGVLLTTFLITLAVIGLILVGLFAAGRFFPGLSFENIPERFEAWRRRRLEKKMKKRGIGYMSMVDADDEYSRLLKQFGLEDGASESEIKRAYRKLVKQHHPDAHGAAGAVTDEEGNVDRTFEELKKNYQRLLEIRGSQFGR